MFNQETADRICARLAAGESLRKAAEEEGAKVPTFLLWCNNNPPLAEQYARAISMRADVKFDELEDVSEEAVYADSAVKVAGLRLKADNIKWQLARMSPRKYGDKIDHTVTGTTTHVHRVELVALSEDGTGSTPA